MQTAKRSHKPLVEKILTESFADNKSVNYVIKQDHSRLKRIKHLVSYSFNICFDFGEIYIADDESGCALVLFPEKKKTTIRSTFLDLGLLIKSIGMSNLSRTIQREKAVADAHPDGLLYHIWYIGVLPEKQGGGTGTNLLRFLVQKAHEYKRIPVLETSTYKNISWYQKNGFSIYREIDLGFPLYCFKMGQ